MISLILANSEDFRSLLDNNPQDFFKRILCDQALEWKVLSSLFTDFIAATMPHSVTDTRLIYDKMKIDNFLNKTITTIKNLHSPEGQMRINGDTVNIAYAQQICKEVKKDDETPKKEAAQKKDTESINKPHFNLQGTEDLF